MASGALAVTANGQPPASDPNIDSPSGTVYQLPLDTARRDAAPTGAGDRSNGSAIRSENNFGSSAVVPGTGPPATADQGAGSAQSDKGGPPVQRDGRSSGGTNDPAASSGVPATLADDSSGPSPTVAIALLVAVVLIGAGIGGGSARRRRG